MNIPPVTLKSGRKLGNGHPAYIIAEIGSNHDGSLERAKELIRMAKQAGADAAKFQSFTAETLVNRKCLEKGRWKAEPAWEILEKLSLPIEWHRQLQEEAHAVGIDFLSTPFDLERLQLLIDLNVPLIKIASGDLTYLELLRAAGKSERPVVMSTGHATLGEIETALKVLWEAGCKDIILLQCASIYPSTYKDANIPAMVTMQHGFRVLVGYSDHTPGSLVPLGAVALGATVIEKHFTDDKSRQGPDHAFALDASEFAAMVQQIRHLEEAMVGGKKFPRPGEESERVMARRAIYAKVAIRKGEKIQRDLVKIVRHAYPEGISADRWAMLNGKVAAQDIAEDDLITWEMF